MDIRLSYRLDGYNVKADVSFPEGRMRAADLLPVHREVSDAITNAVMSRVQNDIKVSLAYASLTQVGIIVVEIGLGLRYLALIHIIGHACLRTMQLLRAPTLLRDYNELENKMGTRLPRESGAGSKFLPGWLQDWSYRFGFDRAFMDLALDRWVVRPFIALFRWFDRLEHRATDLMSNESSRESDHIDMHPEAPGRAA